MGDERARMVFTDPPYNVPIDGHVGGSGATRHREFVMASGEMSKAAFKAFLETVFRHLAEFSMDGSIHYVCMDWRHMAEMLAAGQAAYAELKNLIVWVKDNGGMGTFYRSRHELIFTFKNGTAPHINSFELGQHGRYRTNVWQYRGANSFGSGRMQELPMHPTVKPVAMIADAIKDVSERQGIVLDAFGGSGSTLIAAHKTGRRARSSPWRTRRTAGCRTTAYTSASPSACRDRGGAEFPRPRSVRQHFERGRRWWARQDSNLQPDRYERPALTS